MLGPVVKINPDTLPRAANLHYLGMKTYEQLPDYLAGWDAAIMPFAHNEATRYISPTKTPEYLAAGLPVASTSIHDVVEPYSDCGLVAIGDGPEGFLAACARALDRSCAPSQAPTRSWARCPGIAPWAAIGRPCRGRHARSPPRMS